MNIVDVAANNNLRILQLLLAVPGSVSQDDLDLALLACIKLNEGHEECIRTLLNAGASPDSTDRAGNFALKIAAEKGSTEIIHILAEYGVSVNSGNYHRGTALHFAASANQSESVKTLIDLGANVDARDSSGCTPLVLCAQSKLFAPMNELIRANCQLDLADDRGWTALHYASHKAMGVDTLLKAGANPNVKDKDDNRPIHMAATEGFDNVVMKLLNHGCDPNVVNCFQKSALHYLAMKNHWKAIDAISDVHGDLTIPDADGNTPLFYAVQRNRPEAVKALLRANCKLDPFPNVSTQGVPLQLALQRELYGIAKLLVLAGAPLSPVYRWLYNVEEEKEERERARTSSRLFLDSDEDEESEDEDEDLEDALEWFRDWLHRPHTLQQTCRMAIRHFIGSGMLSKQDNLPVPPAIRDYITLREVEDHHVEGFLL